MEGELDLPVLAADLQGAVGIDPQARFVRRQLLQLQHREGFQVHVQAGPHSWVGKVPRTLLTICKARCQRIGGPATPRVTREAKCGI